MTWEAIFEQWPWFAAAAVLVIVVGLLFLLKPKSKRHLNATGSTAQNKGWVLTGRIDFVDPHSNGELVLQVEETQIANSPSGVEHREIQGNVRRSKDGFSLLPRSTEALDVG